MGATTAEQPKCLTRLAGKPLLSWQLEALNRAGLSDITVISGYASHMLEGGPYGLRHNPRWAESNMVTTLCCASDLLQRTPCVVAYADIVYRPGHVSRLAAAPGNLAITYDTDWARLWKMRFADPLADAETFREHEGLLQEIGARAQSLDQIQGQFMGLLRFTPASWHNVEALLASMPAQHADRLDMTRLLSLLLGRGEKISCVPVSGGWCEVDSEQDLACYEKQIAEHSGWPHDWRSNTALSC